MCSKIVWVSPIEASSQRTWKQHPLLACGITHACRYLAYSNCQYTNTTNTQMNQKKNQLWFIHTWVKISFRFAERTDDIWWTVPPAPIVMDWLPLGSVKLWLKIALLNEVGDKTWEPETYISSLVKSIRQKHISLVYLCKALCISIITYMKTGEKHICQFTLFAPVTIFRVYVLLRQV